MKNIYKLMLPAVGLLMVTANLNAQNRYTYEGESMRSTTIVTTDNMEVTQIDKNMIQCSTVNNPLTNVRENAVTHILTINTSDKASKTIYVAGENYYNMVSNSFSEAVEEGYYDILVNGSYYDENDERCQGFLVYDQVAVFEDVTIDATFDDCVFTIGLDLTDENGQTLSGSNFINCDYEVSFRWLGGSKWQTPWSISSHFFDYPYLTEIPKLRYNGFDERSFIDVNVCLNKPNQVVYNIGMQLIGMYDNVILANDPYDFVGFQEQITLNDNVPSASYFYLNSIVWYDERTQEGLFTYSETNPFDTERPITIFSNNKITDIYDYSNSPKRMMLPFVYESAINQNTYPVYENSIVSAGYYINAENEVVRESFVTPKNIILNIGMLPVNYIGNFFHEPTPTTIIGNAQEILNMEGRTPLTYYQAYAIKANETESSTNNFKPNVFSIGDNGCDRVGDNCAHALITFDGEEIFNDSLYKWTPDMEYQSENAGLVTIDIDNRHLVTSNIEKYNQTHIEFDFNRDDVTAPTMTILQVKNEEGKESINIPQLVGSNISFAAGDFSPHYTEEGGYGHYDYMQYDGKPNIQAYCSLEDEDEIYWMSLICEENETMFHENYGNYYNIPLVQLAGMYNNEWISLKFILTDEAGNTMEQVLNNVFYVGTWDSIEEQKGISHSVYPNPFQTSFTVNAVNPVSGKAVVNVYNVLGENVYAKSVDCSETTSFSIDGSSLNAGIYFYSIATENGTLQGRIVKE